MPSSESEAKISVRVYPNAAENEVVDFTGRVLRVRVSAPPVKGRANKELVAFLSQILDVGKSKTTIIKGHTSRNKVLTISGLSQQEVVERLSMCLRH